MVEYRERVRPVFTESGGTYSRPYLRKASPQWIQGILQKGPGEYGKGGAEVDPHEKKTTVPGGRQKGTGKRISEHDEGSSYRAPVSGAVR